ncbi:purine biosynthesis protein purh : Bifunctional purine biosynthesis protein PurH OS=Desulfotomaculum ruminis (strain ATCC 23193 / DSM 2154 / NCIB 8452 / DL) GN=purH PE=3 SV=1: MGS: AICARFT_IMPCHas [Gemmata massiliana]|uniref:Bifunctional purine biosynthesis protein PurH n=1 Tax=Gemmata massiliana TaxID=1210884 RepID=A0A6P2CTL4_9BACT|nr:bifunctional phosphoribosylaminoimidazolecarboxamide formyltransferase/IMP cyclohydrolase [Gemmata massiliana]VTR92243.1 purine biosynthesis protein purh : Bifunctional purine biosynthesis protein PurH OS=Desulfotomaculum ruminis (strain ATCC 23193 / DSM 2154 / NCIB 8452 / DL) GN=purH PE=3 SV=1: MGS: AICARFT_IMPCHas [Gemmata massiliana]
MLRPIRRALLSVSDKTGLVDFARELASKYGVELIATGGTRKALADAGLPVKDISELTKFPEILDGRVKTLHPAIYAGLLAKRDKSEHMQTLVEHALPEIDLVVCNLYPFEQTVAKPGVTEAEAIENIDIGGPCMVRAAAKNFASVTIIVDPVSYGPVLKELGQNAGQLSRETRRELASGAFARIAAYDHAIANYFLTGGAPGEVNFDDPDVLPLLFIPNQKLRYGENPHQRAAFYSDGTADRPCVATAEQLHGKELSYNNILDLDSALNLAREFAAPACVVVKHNNPCGAATAGKLADAFGLAWDGDPLSAFGGIIAFNRPVDVDTASALMDPKAKRFIECVIAPDYEPYALDGLRKWKENVRLLKTGDLTGFPKGLDYRRVDGGLLVQARDYGADKPDAWKVVTKRKPTEAEFNALYFSWFVCKHVKSNAIVLARDTQVVGVGAGQMSRVVSVEIAVKKAGEKSKGSVLASDAFFPFPDNVHAAAAAGVTAIIQPGGSVKDPDSIAACDEHGIAMLFTGVRHFRH